ncbi:hypothetical protein ABBQ32_003421 [Trebouxia sp. C0010 RCD-2024]
MMMQAQTHRTAVLPTVSTSRVVATRCHPKRLQAFSGVSQSFAKGTAFCARPVRKVTNRCQTQRIHADVFYTQKTVPDQTGRVAIVTGSSSGMGFEVAKCLSQKNATVIIAARDKQKCEKAAAEIKAQGGRGRIEAMELDLTSFRSIKAFADRYLELGLPLHTLVNNAGVFLVPHDHTQEGFETTVGTNYFGHYYLTHLLLDKLIQTQKEDGMARAVFMSSTFEQLGNINWSDLEMYKSEESGLFEYATSKIMKLMLARELNKRLKGTGVEMFAAQPGLVSSPLYSKGDHKKATMLAVEFFQSFYGQSPVRGCRGLLRAATDPNLRGRGGQYFSPPYLSVVTFHLNNAGRFFPYHKSSRNEGDWKRLYDQSLDIVNRKLKEKSLPAIKAV